MNFFFYGIKNEYMIGEESRLGYTQPFKEKCRGEVAVVNIMRR